MFLGFERRVTEHSMTHKDHTALEDEGTRILRNAGNQQQKMQSYIPTTGILKYFSLLQTVQNPRYDPFSILHMRYFGQLTAQLHEKHMVPHVCLMNIRFDIKITMGHTNSNLNLSSQSTIRCIQQCTAMLHVSVYTTIFRQKCT